MITAEKFIKSIIILNNMRLKDSALVLLLVMSVGVAGVTGCGHKKRHNSYSQVPTNPQEYQRSMDIKRHNKNQERKGRWAGQYKSGKPIHKIPTRTYNGYRSFRRGMKRGF